MPTLRQIQSVLSVLAGLTCFVVAAGASAGDSGQGGETCAQGKRELALRSTAFDEATGRDRRNFPPDLNVDFLHMKLQMRFEDLNQKRFTAIETLTFAPIAVDAPSLALDAVGLQINSVKVNGSDAASETRVEYTHDGKRLALRFDPPLPAGQKRDLVIEYVCDHPTDGMFFTPSASASSDMPEYSAEVHTQGEADTNRCWFVCHDFPNDRMSTELIVDVPAGFSVCSNGKLLSSLTSGERAVWHWLQEKPHVAYLVTLVIGKFDIVEIPPSSKSHVPMKVWVPVGRGGDVLQTYGRTGEMIDMFERLFGVAYPWDRYDQILAKNFNAGGMENTAATTMYPTAVLDKTALLDGDLDGQISHELCHQWTGDYITCRSWAHIWLNEGWASFGNDLWDEQRYGTDGYLEAIRDEFGIARGDRTGSNDIPMVSPVYEDPDDVFGRTANPYPKGASILHMLRMMLGDDVFWKGVRVYFQRHGMGLAETNDFRYALEEASGRGLEWFFEQWCYRPGTPELTVKESYNGETRELSIDIEQTQKIDERTPAFRFTLPVVVRSGNGGAGDRTFSIEVNSKSTSFKTTLDNPPVMVAIDPNLHVLKSITEDKPLTWWMEQARGGSGSNSGEAGTTIVARHDAIEAIGQFDSSATIALLSEIIRNDSERWTIRNRAIEALAKYGSPEGRQALLEIAKSGTPEAKVRVRLVEKLRGFDKAQAAEALAKFAGEDSSYGVRAAAIEGLAALKCTEQADLIASQIEFASHNDQVRNAAIQALAEFDDARGLEAAMKYAAYGHSDRSRPQAIRCIGRLAKHDQDKAVETLIGLLDDHEQRAVNAAGAALADLGDTRAETRLQQMADSASDPTLRTSAKGWLETLRKKKG